MSDFLDDVADGEAIHLDPYRVKGSRFRVSISWTQGGAVYDGELLDERLTGELVRRFGDRYIDAVSAREICAWLRDLG